MAEKDQGKFEPSIGDETAAVPDGAASGDHHAAASVSPDPHTYLELGEDGAKFRSYARVDDHVVVVPPDTAEPCSKTNVNDNSEDPYEYKQPEDVSFGHKARERATEMWTKATSSKVYQFTLSLGLLAIVLTAILVPTLKSGAEEVHGLESQVRTVAGTNLNTTDIPYMGATQPSTTDGTALTWPSTTVTFQPTMTLPSTTVALSPSTVTLPTKLNPVTLSTKDIEKQCPSGWKEYNHHCYTLNTSAVSWSTAQSMCQQEGADLNSIMGRWENRFIADIFARAVARAWIGLHKTGRSWTWIGGSPLTYKNWAPSEPNNYLNRREYCVYMILKKISHEPWRKRGKWNDVTCGSARPYIYDGELSH